MNIPNVPGLCVLAVEQTTRDYRFCVQTTTRSVVLCPHCCTRDVVHFGTHATLYRDVPLHGKRVTVRLLRQRYRCRRCRRTFLDPVPAIDERHRATTRLVAYIRCQALARTFASIADEVGLDERTIRRIFQEYAAEVERGITFRTPRWLGLSTVQLIGPRCLVGNVAAGTAVALLPACSEEAVVSHLQALPGRGVIAHVCLDLWEPYHQAARTVLPQAQLIVDHGHVVRLARRCLAEVWEAERATLPDRGRRALRRERTMFQRRWHDLGAADRARLEAWARRLPVLGQAWAQTETFAGLWDSATGLEARARYKDWQAHLDRTMAAVFAPVVRAMAAWAPELYASVDRPVPPAYTAALDAFAQAAGRLGRGHSFEAMRIRLLYAEHLQKHAIRPLPPRGSRATADVAAEDLLDAPMARTLALGPRSPLQPSPVPMRSDGVDLMAVATAVGRGDL